MPGRRRSCSVAGMTSVERVVALWKEEGVALLPPLKEGVIVATLARTGRRFSRDVVDLYRVTGGMDGTMAGSLFSLWPLKHVGRPMGLGDPADPADLAFGDFLIDSFWYYFRYEDEGRSAVYGGYDFRRLAGSIGEFFEIYLRDPADIGALQ